MSQLLRTLLTSMITWWIDRQRQKAMNRWKAQGVRTYLKVLNGARMSAIGIASLLIVLQMFVVGLAIMGGAGIFLSSWEMDTKLWALFALGSGLFLLSFAFLFFLLSQRVWYRLSGAQRMVDDLLEDAA